MWAFWALLTLVKGQVTAGPGERMGQGLAPARRQRRSPAPKTAIGVTKEAWGNGTYI